MPVEVQRGIEFHKCPIVVAAASPHPEMAVSADRSGPRNAAAVVDGVGKALLSLAEVSGITYSEVQIDKYKPRPAGFAAKMVLESPPADATIFRRSVERHLRHKLWDIGIEDINSYLKRTSLNFKIIGGSEATVHDLGKAFASPVIFGDVSISFVRVHPRIRFRGGKIVDISSPDGRTRFYGNRRRRTEPTREGHDLLYIITEYLTEILGTRASLRIEVHSHTRRYGSPRNEETVTGDRAFEAADSIVSTLEIKDGWDVTLFKKGYGSTRPVVPDNLQDAMNSHTDIYIKGKVRVVERPRVMVKKGSQGENPSPARDIVAAAPEVEPLWRKFVPRHMFGGLSGSFNLLKGSGTSNLSVLGGQLDYTAGWPLFEADGHSLIIGLAAGFGLARSLSTANACYPQDLGSDGASGCMPDKPNRRLRLGTGLHWDAGLRLIWKPPPTGGGMRFYVSVLSEYHWSKYAIEKDASAVPESIDIAQSDDNMTQQQIVAGLEAALTFEVSDFEMGLFVRFKFPVVSWVHEGPASIHFPYLNVPLVSLGLVLGSHDIFARR